MFPKVWNFITWPTVDGSVERLMAWAETYWRSLDDQLAPAGLATTPRERRLFPETDEILAALSAAEHP